MNKITSKTESVAEIEWLVDKTENSVKVSILYMFLLKFVCKVIIKAEVALRD